MIRSQNLTFPRNQSINRGAFKVISTHRHPFYTVRRKGIHHKFKNSKRETKTKDQLCFSKDDKITRKRLCDNNVQDSIENETINPETISGVRHNLLLNNFFLKSSTINNSPSTCDSSISENIPALNFVDSLLSRNSYFSDDGEESDLSSTICLVSKPKSSKTRLNKSLYNVEKTLRFSETDSMSNDECSESTVVSLGQKIQRMAREENIKCCTNFSTENTDESVDNDDEWKQLLHYNHGLILSSFCDKENFHFSEIPEKHLDETINSFIPENEITGDNIELKENTVAEKTINVDNLLEERLNIKVKLNSNGFEDSHIPPFNCLHKNLSKNNFSIALDDIDELDDVSEECVEEIPNTIDAKEDEERCETDKKKDSYKPSKVCFENANDLLTSKDKLETKNKNENKEYNEQFSDKKTSESKDDSPDLANKEKVKEQIRIYPKEEVRDDKMPDISKNLHAFRDSLSLFSSPVPCSKIAERHQSKDIISALEMIERDQNKQKDKACKDRITKDIEKGHKTTDGIFVRELKELPKNSENPEVGNGMEKENKFQPSVSHLIQKILIFSQELGTKWKDGDLPEDKSKLKEILDAEKILEEICLKRGVKRDEKTLPEFHRHCEEKYTRNQNEMEERIHKNLDLVRKLLDDKKSLTEKYEQISLALTQKERSHLDKVKLLNEKHALEMKSLKEKLLCADQARREKWTQHKTKLIKDSTYRGLETKLKDLTTQHREEMNHLKEMHWKELRESEEKWMQKVREQEEQMKAKYEREKEEECKREREREVERFQQEFQRSELIWQSRLDAFQRQFSLTKTEWEENTQRQVHRLEVQHENEIHNLNKELDTKKVESEDKIRNLMRMHENEISSVCQNKDKAQAELNGQMAREYEETKQKFEREVRERLRRQRDREIEKAITEIQQEMTLQLEEKQRSYDAKIKNLRERYEAELRDLEECERISRTRYLEMKGMLAQKEEEIVYLRARLHTQTLEISDIQQMFHANG